MTTQPPRSIVLVGLLGPTLDRGLAESRWNQWRPTVALCSQEDLLVDRFELIYQQKFKKLADRVIADIATVSPETTVCRRLIEWDDAWDFEQVYAALFEVSRQLEIDHEREEMLVNITTGTHVAQICLFLLTESRHLPGRLIQSSPSRRASDGVAGRYALIDLDLSKYDRLAARFEREHKEGASFLKSGIETRNARFNKMIEQIERVAIRSSAPILLMGPTGAGKSRLAKRIFQLKKIRRQLAGEFVEVNCATLRGDKAMSTLFGHVRGAFTGAASDRPGLLRKADHGMLFLDEVGELGADEQAMLLRALEEKRFFPMGSDREVACDFQLCCGTNRDLIESVHQGRFRDDLFARINLWTFRLPGLRERPEDISPNLGYELDAFAGSAGTNVRFNKAARERFLGFSTSSEARWRSNFRDLNAAVTRMATLAPGGRITVDVVDEEIERLCALWAGDGEKSGDQQLLASVLSPQQLAELDLFDRVQLIEVIRICAGARTLSEAGRLLFNVSRTRKKNPNDADRLRKYLARFGLRFDQLRGLAC